MRLTHTHTLTHVYICPKRNMGKRQTMAGNLVIAPPSLLHANARKAAQKGGASVEMANTHTHTHINQPHAYLSFATSCSFVAHTQTHPQTCESKKYDILSVKQALCQTSLHSQTLSAIYASVRHAHRPATAAVGAVYTVNKIRQYLSIVSILFIYIK